MITAPTPVTTPAAATFVPTSMSLETVGAGPDGATGEWMRGTVKLDIDLRPADAADIRPTHFQATSVLADGTKVIDFGQDMPVSPAERAAATGLAQAFEGSNILKQAVPYTPGSVADNTSRILLEDATGAQLAYTEPAESPDHPGDAKLKAALNTYMEALGLAGAAGL
jgi:hypothetical protein